MIKFFGSQDRQTDSRLSLALIKFFGLVGFKEIFHFAYHAPSRQPKLGHYYMMVRILKLLFIGFNWIWHFVYVRIDPMLCGFFNLTRLPAASTFWRYVDSLGINQAHSILKIKGTKTPIGASPAVHAI